MFRIPYLQVQHHDCKVTTGWKQVASVSSPPSTAIAIARSSISALTLIYSTKVGFYAIIIVRLKFERTRDEAHEKWELGTRSGNRRKLEQETLEHERIWYMIAALAWVDYKILEVVFIWGASSLGGNVWWVFGQLARLRTTVRTSAETSGWMVEPGILTWLRVDMPFQI